MTAPGQNSFLRPSVKTRQNHAFSAFRTAASSRLPRPPPATYPIESTSACVSDATNAVYDSRVSHVISAVGGNTTFTATPTNGNSANQTVIYVMEYQGITSFDASGFSASGNPNVTSVTTTATSDLLISFSFNYTTGQSNGNPNFTVERTLTTPTLNSFIYTMAMDAGAAVVGTYSSTVNATGVNTQNQFLVAYKTSGTPTGQPIFRSLAASDLPNNGTPATPSNCSSSASPAVCLSSAAGSVVIAAGATTVQVNTSAAGANSQIFVFPDETLGTKLGVTCNTTLATVASGLAITARTAGTSFTISTTGTISTNPVCLNYLVVN
jgi:hypothetical protein